MRPDEFKSRGFILGKVVAGFTGTGKSYLAGRYDNVVDVDLGNYRFVYDGPEDVPFEARKAMKKYEIQPGWPQNYLDAVIENIGRYDVVLVTFCSELEEFLSSEGIDLYYFMPNKSAWEIIEKRLRARGNNERFIEITKARFDAEVGFAGKGLRKMSLDDDEFLEDALVRNGFLDSSKKRSN